MKQFKFTLQPLYNVKTNYKKLKQLEYAEAKEALEKLKRQQAQLNMEAEEFVKTFRASMTKGTTVFSIATYSNYSKYITDELERLKNEINNAVMDVEIKQAELITLMRELNSLENLKQEQYADYLKEVSDEEEKELGDLMSYNSTTSEKE